MACEQVTLQDVCELIVDCPHTSAKDEGVGYPLIRTPNVGRGRLILTDVHRVSQDVYERRVSRAVPRQGDLILAREAPAGNVAIVSPGIEVCLGQRTMLLRPDSSFVVPEYLNYYLNAPEQRDRMLRLANGATVSHINVADIRNMPVQLPSRGEQSKVAELLNVLDDKIDLNNRLNDYLSQICDAEFTDFVSNQRDASWHDGTLNELVEIRYGKDHKKLAEGPYPVYGSGGFMRSVEKPLSSGESVLIPRKGSLNNVMYVDEKFWTVDTMFFTIPLKPGAAKYVYQYTKRLDFGTMNSGSAVPSMTTKILNSLVIPIPSDSALVSFNKKLQPFFDLFGKNEEENRRLVSLRDILLPKLMSGEIDVSKVDLTQLTNNHLPARGHNVPNCYWKEPLWKPSLIVFCRRCRTCLIRHSSNI